MRRTHHPRRIALATVTALASLLTLVSSVLAGSGGGPFPK